MLTQSIAQYLTSHKRLVIPQLGTFIVKEPGRSILFSELLKRDDGVLRGVLRETGLSELEAAGEIDRFVFEVRHAIQSGATCPLPGLGELRPGANGTIAFHYDPTTASSAATPAGSPESAAPAVNPVEASADRTPARTAAISPAESPISSAMPHAATSRRHPDVSEASEASEAPASAAWAGASEPAATSDASETSRPQSRRETADRVARSVEHAFTDPYVSPSAKMNPDPSVRGLRYGKAPKNTSGYTFVDRPTRRRADRFLWIAIAAAVIALAAIGFGYWRERHDQEIAEQEYLEYRHMIDSSTNQSDAAADESQTAQPAQN